MDRRGQSPAIFLPKNRRGQGMSISTIILLILGLVVLVVLILGFVIGWNKLLPFLPKDNIGTVVNQCTFACTSNSVYDFCTKTIDLNLGNGTTYTDSCYNFSTNPSYSTYEIESCSALAISCAAPAV